MAFIKSFIGCIGGCADYTDNSTNHFDAQSDFKKDLSAQDAANKILNVLFNTRIVGGSLEKSLKDIEHEAGVHKYGWDWRENFYVRVFKGLQKAIEKGAPMGKTMKEAFIRATNAAVEFAKDHPQYCMIIAIGILVIMAPWILEAVGFGFEGPIADTFAALWQSRYAGYVPEGSLFSYLQRLGMTWRIKSTHYIMEEKFGT